MKILSGIIGFLLATVALCFAFSNRQPVTISLWPFDLALEAPLYLLSLGTLFMGLLFGAVVAWLMMIPHRLQSRRLHKDIANLNQKIIDLQQTVLAPRRDMDTLPAPSKWDWRFWEPKL